MSQKKDIKKLFVSLAIIPILFVLGTPYSLLSPQEFLSDIESNILIFSQFGTTELSLTKRILKASSWFLFLSDIEPKIYMGSLWLLGLFVSLFMLWKKESLLILCLCAMHILIVGAYHNPAIGYLLQVFPLFLILCVSGVLQFLSSMRYTKVKFLGGVIVTIFLLMNLSDGVQVAYSFTIDDTRTLAKNWIESNISQGSKILIDFKVHSPPLLTSYAQLKRYNDEAIKINHYKKHFFESKLKTHPGGGYEIVQIKRPYEQIGGIPGRVEKAQQISDMIDVDANISVLRKKGIEYAIVDWSSRENAVKNNYINIREYYLELPKRAKLMATFLPKFRIYHGNKIEIYKI